MSNNAGAALACILCIGGGPDAVVKADCLESQRSQVHASADQGSIHASHSSHHPQDVILAQFSLCMHEDGLNPHSFHLLLHAFQQTRDIYPMLFQCWATVFDAGPTLNQHWVNGWCLLVCRRPHTQHYNI